MVILQKLGRVHAERSGALVLLPQVSGGDALIELVERFQHVSFAGVMDLMANGAQVKYDWMTTMWA